MSNLITLPQFNVPGMASAKYEVAHREETHRLRQLIWVYFILLIVEGALRKWIMPSMANPLLIIRDPVVVLIYIVAMTTDNFPKNAFTIALAALGVVSFFASELAGSGNLLISVYGWRTNFLHLPLIFIIPKVLNADDVHKMAKWLMYMALPMALLVVAQFRASPESWLNVGAGGSVGGQMEVSFGKIRPAGTFSFNTGMVDFIGLLAAYIISTQMTQNSPNRKWAMMALPALLIMVAVSGSRTSLGVVAVILAGVAFICVKKPVFFGKGMKGLFLLGGAYFVLSFWTEFRTGLMVHENRIEVGGGFQEGILYRVLGEFMGPFRVAAQTPLLGKGLGMGTNVAAGLLFGERGFLLAESEWERVVLESGPIIGMLYIFLRLGIFAYLIRKSLQALEKENPLPLLILCAVAPELVYGQFAVPSTLGFTIFNAGFCLAACSLTTESNPILMPLPPAELQEPPKKKTVRGRSIYAEKLHGE